MKKFKTSKFFKKKKKNLGLRALGSYFLGCFKKKKKIINQNFQFLQKNSGFPNFFQKKKKSKIFNSFEKFKFSKFKKKKKKISLNSSTGTESYDLLPHSPVMQH